VHAGLGHQAQQSSRLQRDRFASGIWPRDDEQMKPVTEANIDRHHRAALLASGLWALWLCWRRRFRRAGAATLGAEQVFQERMPGLPKPKSAIAGDLRLVHVVVAAEACLGRDEIELSHDLDGMAQRPSDPAHFPGKAPEDAVDFAFLGGFED